MEFRKFEGPFNDAEGLALRDLFCSDRLILDLIEAKRVKPSDAPPPGISENEYYILEPTDESRVWRLTYDPPFGIKLRGPSLEPKEGSTSSLTAVCVFSEKSEWIDEFNFGAQLAGFVPTHYIFALTDHYLEVLADGNPMIQQVENALRS